jgi:uncharacterized protein YyaL (SSP411 family)
MVVSMQKQTEHEPSAQDNVLTPNDLAKAADQLAEQFDGDQGGFGPAPKFPTPQNVTFLLRRHRRTGDERFKEMATATLDAMRLGGIHDHLGGGFHRYTTDANWLTPHFEKMLYDQAALAVAYTEGYLATGNAAYAQTARATLTYVARDLSDPLGGFTCGEDADSEGEEGRFYVWSKAEIMEVLGPEEGQTFCDVYGVSAEGNYHDEATGEAMGTNILNLSADSEVGSLYAARTKLFARREGRVRPHHDDKVLSGWNGLMISAFARAGRALEEPSFLERAEACADFLFSHLWKEGRLLRRYRDGEAAVDGFSDDYAFVARGLLDLFEATGKVETLERALAVAAPLWSRFGGEEGYGLTDTPADGETLILTTREVYDGPIPSANSAALELFARLWLITGDPVWEERARSLLVAFTKTVRRFHGAYCHFLQAASLLIEPTRQLVIVGDKAQPETLALRRAICSTYSPETSCIYKETSNALSQEAPYLANMELTAGQPAAHLCENFACSLPITEPEALRAALADPPPSR